MTSLKRFQDDEEVPDLHVDSSSDNISDSISSISSLSDICDDGAEPVRFPSPLPEIIEEEFQFTLRQRLALWIVTHHIAQAHGDDLLHILHEYHPDLPLCTRALVGTPRSVPLLEMPPGLYYHRGLEEAIRHALFPYGLDEVPEHLLIFVSIDGVSLTSSSSSQFWPITCFIPFLPDADVFEVGVYWGLSKPSDSNLFLSHFVRDAIRLSTTGMMWKGRTTYVYVKAWMADAPARALLACVKSHSSFFHGCPACYGFGITLGELRTDQDFRNQLDADHHHFRSIIQDLLYLNCVTSIPRDAMHLCDNGIMKRILEFLFKTGKRTTIPGVTLSPANIRCFNSSLVNLWDYISRIDFARSPPLNVKDITHMKSAQYRQFLHYTGVPLFRQHLGSRVFQHFLLFHCAIRLLSSHPWCIEKNALAYNLLCQFIVESPNIFTESFVCPNLHSLYHIAADVLNHGPLYSYSAYRFENHYRLYKKMLKKTHGPLQQLCRRLQERNQFSHLLEAHKRRTKPIGLTFSNRHNRGPLVRYCHGMQYEEASFAGRWTLKSSSPDNVVFLKDLTVIKISNFVQCNGRNFVIGRRFQSRCHFYKSPFPSGVIHEYRVSNLSSKFEAYDMNQIKFKAVCIPAHCPNTSGSFFVSALLMQ